MCVEPAPTPPAGDPARPAPMIGRRPSAGGAAGRGGHARPFHYIALVESRSASLGGRSPLIPLCGSSIRLYRGLGQWRYVGGGAARVQHLSEGRSLGDPYCVIVAGSPDVIVIGAGVVGASCAYYLASSGAHVQLLDRSFVASGSSGACEGNVLAWDKELERELPLALRSAELWAELAERLPDDFEYDRKGSVVVAETETELAASAERAQTLAGLGVKGEVLDAGALRREEPYAAHDLPGGALYPGDAQLEPRLATAALVKAAVAQGATLTIDRSVERLT